MKNINNIKRIKIINFRKKEALITQFESNVKEQEFEINVKICYNSTYS